MNTIDIVYQNILEAILNHGVDKKDRTGIGTKSVFGYQIRHNMQDGFPLLTTKKMYFKGIVTELLWFLRGDTNIKYLVDNDCHIWDGDAYKNYLTSYTKDIKSGNLNYDHSGRAYPDNPQIKENWLRVWEHDGKYYKITGLPNHAEWCNAGPLTKEEFINKIKTDKEWEEKWGELGPIYGKQWRRWKTKEYPTNEPADYSYIDQIANLINELKTNPDSRRLMVNAWNVGELDSMVLPPCHYGFQVYTRELSLEERVRLTMDTSEYRNYTEDQWKDYIDTTSVPKRAISLMWNQRSVDTFLGLPFNIASYGLLLTMIADELNMVPDELIGNLGDVHLYTNHIEQAKEQISREPYELPKVSVRDGIHCSSINDVILENYKSHPSIKAPLSN